MKKNLNPLKSQEGQKRIVTKFLWFPKVLDGELRWLEKVKILQEVQKVDIGGSGEWGKYKHSWINLKFVPIEN